MLLLLAAATACGDEGRTPRSPGAAALELFRLARQTEPDAERVDRLFGPPADAGRRAALHDALELLADVSEPRVLMAEPFRPDTWRSSDDGPQVRDPAGEYLPVTFLTGGGLAVVSAVQNQQENRWGFSWWKVDTR